MNPFRQFLLSIRTIIDKILYKTSSHPNYYRNNIINCTTTNSYENIKLSGTSGYTIYGNTINAASSSNAIWIPKEFDEA